MTTTKFEISDYLESKEMIAEYLITELEKEDSDDLIIALGHIAKAIGMSKMQRRLEWAGTASIKPYP